MILPGDLVAFITDDDDVSAQIIESIKPKAPDSSPFLSRNDDLKLQAIKLQAIWRARNEIWSRRVYIVISASCKRAMVFSNNGRILITETRFLDKLNQENNQC